MCRLRILLLALAILGIAYAQDTPQLPPAVPSLMPMPAKLTMGTGRLRIDSAFRVHVSGYQDPRLRRGVVRMIATLHRMTGLPLSVEAGGTGDPVTLSVHAEHSDKTVQDLSEDESYRLEIDSAGAHLTAAQPLGALHGLQTFLQLVVPGPDGFDIAAMTIEDRPRFGWRGLMLDVSRHFMPVENVERTLEGMAAVKLNVFHWHLSDNQGFRVESHLFPRLHRIGSDGFYYTQAQIRHIVSYARDRGIRVIPEFDIPGHATAMLVAYPALATDPAPVELDHLFGIFDPAIDPTKPSVYAFLDRFIGEMSELFPDAYFHIGGDEVNGRLWRESLSIQQFKKVHGFLPTATDPDGNVALHAYFNQHLEALLRKHGKRMEGWDEIVAPTLPKDILIQSWRGQKSLADAVHLGYQGILSFGWYLDLIHSAQDHYAVDPMDKEAALLSPQEQARILGGEAAIWSEWVTPETIDSRIWPRAAVVAERLWSSKETRDNPDMYRRLEVVSRNLEWLGLTHRSWQHLMLQRLAGSEDVEILRSFAEMLEPVKNYDRENFGPYTTTTPLIRLVDAVPPESEVARKFSDSVSDAIAHPANVETLRTQLLIWQRSSKQVNSILTHNELLSGVEPLRNRALLVTEIGLEGVECLASRVNRDEEWKTRRLAQLQTLRLPDAALNLAIIDPIIHLISVSCR